MISRQLTNWLIAKKVIAMEEKEIYEYGIFQLLMNAIDTFSILTLALLFHEVPATCCYLIAFCMLRKYAGGYHAKTVLGCYFITLTSALCMMIMIKIKDIPLMVQLIVWLISSVVIILFVPMQNMNKKLDEVEELVYRNRAIITWTIETIVMAVMYGLKFTKCFEGILIGHICVSISILAEMIYSQSIKRKGD